MQNHQTRTRRASATLVLVVATAALLASGCGGNDDSTASKDSNTKETTTTAKKSSGGDSGGIASGILDKASKSGKFGSGEFDSDTAECVGGSVIDSLGEDGAQEMSAAAAADYTSDQVDALVTAFNDCVPGSMIAPTMVSSFYEGMGVTQPTDSAMVECVGNFVEGKTGEIVKEGLAAEATDAMPEITLKSFDKCMPPDDITGLLEKAFASSGLTNTQASCVAAALKGQITVSDLVAAGAPGGDPALEAKVKSAAEGCR